MKKMLAILMGLLLMTESTGIAVQGYTGASAGTEPQDSVQGDSWSSSIPDLPDAGEYEEESVPDPVFIEEVSEDGSTYDNDDPSISWIESDAQIEGDIQIEGEEVETGEEIEEDEDEDLITAGDESDSPEDDVFFDDELIGDEELSGTGFYGDDADESGQEKAMNGIPLVVIRIDEKELHQSKKGNWYGTIADMNESSDHSVRCEGSAEIVLPESGYQSEYGGAVPPEGTIELDYIRGRGNSTWESQDKRPYKLQFKDKLDLFGMGESKEWALMANAMDPTLIKNRITSWLGDRMGFAWSPQMVPVDVVMIGSESGREYLGSYCLSELVDIEPSRLALAELGKNVTAMEGDPNISGGYLLSVFNPYQDADEPGSNYFTLNSGITLTHENPSLKDEESLTEGRKAQRDYIRSYLQDVDTLIMSEESIDESAHDALASLMDLKSAADYWLIQEFSTNPDSFRTSSTFLNKGRNGRLTFGPLWDFDQGWGDPNTDIWYESSTTGFNNTEAFWMDELRSKDPAFGEILKQEWAAMRPHLEEMISEGGIIDQYQRELMQSKQADIERWPDLTRVHDYELLLSNLKKWISMRITWFDEHLDELQKSMVSISFEADGQLIDTVNIRKGKYLTHGPDAPVKEGYVFIGWFEKNSHDGVKYYKADEDAVFAAEYLEEGKAVRPEALYFSDYEAWVLIGDTFDAAFQACVLPENASNKMIKWTSSDTNVITVDSDGIVKGESIGEAVLTGTLYNGISNSLTVHVYDRSVVSKMPDGLILVPEKAELTPGQTEQIRVIPTPESTLLKYMFLSVTVDDPSCVEVKRGAGNERVILVTGLKEGMTQLTVEAERDDTIFTAVCDIDVTGPEGEAVPKDDKPAGEQPAGEQPAGEQPTGEQPAGEVPAASDSGSAFMKGADAAALDAAITAESFDKDPEGTEFSLLRLRTKKVTRKSVKVVWQKVEGAKKYVIYANACGKNKALKKVKTTTALSFILKKLNGKKLKKGTYYKFMAAALDENDKVITVSKMIYAATKGGSAGNAKSVSVTSKSNRKVSRVTLKAGKTYKLKAKAEAASKTKKISAYRGIKFESSNPQVAQVTSKGRIRTVSAGTCYVYAYAQNGLYRRVTVKVS